MMKRKPPRSSGKAPRGREPRMHLVSRRSLLKGTAAWAASSVATGIVGNAAYNVATKAVQSLSTPAPAPAVVGSLLMTWNVVNPAPEILTLSDAATVRLGAGATA